jgi:ribonucleoside-diphosphate reductase beta chain
MGRRAPRLDVAAEKRASLGHAPDPRYRAGRAAITRVAVPERRVDTLFEAMADGQLWESTLGGHFVLPKRTFWPQFFSKVVARLQWDPAAIDLTEDARAWPELPDERRRRLTTLFAGFRVAEDAVSEHITPFADVAREATLASHESLMAWVFFLQRRDEDRHALWFDRIAAEVLGLPGGTPAERREAAREHVPAAVLELFEVRLPAMAAELAAGRTGLGEGVALYHMVLEGVIFDAAHHALRIDLADGALPGVREGVGRVEVDERWHIGFGLRCLIESQPSRDSLDELLARADEAAAAWGDALPDETREYIADACHHRLAAVGLIEPHGAAERIVRRAPAA